MPGYSVIKVFKPSKQYILLVTQVSNQTEKVLGEKVVIAVGAGGCMLGIYEYITKTIKDVTELYPILEDIGHGDYICDGRLGRNRFYDGDIFAVRHIQPTFGIPSRHVYQMAGRRAPVLEKQIEERYRRENVDEIMDALKEDEVEEFTLVMCIATVSGAGYVICKRLVRFLQPKKAFGGVIRILNLPSVLEPGVESSLMYFLNEEKMPEAVKTMIISTDVAHLVHSNLIKNLNLSEMRRVRFAIAKPKNLIQLVKRISFEGVDDVISKIYAIIFLGSLVRDLQLLHEGNVKRLDSADLLNFLGDGSHYVISAFNTHLLTLNQNLDDVVAMGTMMPMVPSEADAFLESYSVILPKKAAPMLRRIRIGDRRGRIRGIALSSILDQYDIAIAFIRIDLERFKKVYEEFIGVL